MTFYGEQIGERATFLQVEIYCAEQGLFVEPQEVLDYWEKKDWLTNEGRPVKTLESAIHVVNSIAVRREMKRIRKENTDDRKRAKHRIKRNGTDKWFMR